MAADHQQVRRSSLDTASPGHPALVRRLLWFVGLWIAGVAAVAVVGLVIKLMLKG